MAKSCSLPVSRQAPSAVAAIKAAPRAIERNFLDIGDLPGRCAAAIITVRFLAVAADGHVAPETAGVAAAIDEEPAAVGTDPEPRNGFIAQQRKRRDGQGRLEGDRRGRVAERLARRADFGAAAGEPAGAGRQEVRQMAGGDRTFGYGMAEQAVGRLADRQHDRGDVVRFRRLQPPAAELGGTKTARRLGEAGDLGRVIETVEGLFRIVAQHDRVRRVERKDAAGEAVWGPGYRHEGNLTDKTYLTS